MFVTFEGEMNESDTFKVLCTTNCNTHTPTNVKTEGSLSSSPAAALEPR